MKHLLILISCIPFYIFSQENIEIVYDTIYVTDTVWVTRDTVYIERYNETKIQPIEKKISLDTATFSKNRIIQLETIKKIEKMKRITFVSLIGLAFQTAFSQGVLNTESTYWDSVYTTKVHVNADLGFQQYIKMEDGSFGRDRKLLEDNVVSFGLSLQYNFNSKYSLKTGVTLGSKTFKEKFILNSARYVSSDIDFTINTSANFGLNIISIPILLQRRFLFNKSKASLGIEFGASIEKGFLKPHTVLYARPQGEDQINFYAHYGLQHISLIPQLGVTFTKAYSSYMPPTSLKIEYMINISHDGTNYVFDEVRENGSIVPYNGKPISGYSRGVHAFSITLSQTLFNGYNRLKKKAKKLKEIDAKLD